MYAIVEDGGKQYKVQKGDTLYVELRDLAEGVETIEFDRVLLLGEGSDCRIGTPLVAGARVTARLQDELVKGPKVRIFKYRRRKGFRLRKGHRQKYMKVLVDEISA